MRPAGTLSVALAMWLGALPAPVRAQAVPAAAATRLHQYPDADLALGARLIAEHRCTTCHVRKVGGDGAAIYRPAGRINTPSALLSMVELCSTELNLGLFPEDVAAVAAVLQRDHYRFAATASPGTARRPAP
jgi:hypothetical protein